MASCILGTPTAAYTKLRKVEKISTSSQNNLRNDAEPQNSG